MLNFEKKCWLMIAFAFIVVVLTAFQVAQQKAVIQVTKVKLRANPMTYHGPCPAEIKFTAKVTATGSGEVVCRIVRSDNITGPEITFNFARSGTKDTTYIWNATDNFMGWQQLEVIKPNKARSNKAEFSVMCAN